MSCARCHGIGRVDYGPYHDIQMITCPECKGTGAEPPAPEPIMTPAPEPIMTDVDVAAAMTGYGGSFVRALGAAFLCADDVNRARLKLAFEDYWQTYRAVALKRHVVIE